MTHTSSREQALAIIQELEEAIKAREAAPKYRAGSFEGDEPLYDDLVENTAPRQRVLELQRRAEQDLTVEEILIEQKRSWLLNI